MIISKSGRRCTNRKMGLQAEGPPQHCTTLLYSDCFRLWTFSMTMKTSISTLLAGNLAHLYKQPVQRATQRLSNASCYGRPTSRSTEVNLVTHSMLQHTMAESAW